MNCDSGIEELLQEIPKKENEEFEAIADILIVVCGSLSSAQLKWWNK
ncbi:MAG: hypothetical protein F6K47_18960 [Symploca sp. SIO2E6]|nr:hypothetical protein [Symploca sp. SIO2E6]